jgi:hypothetical protein
LQVEHEIIFSRAFAEFRHKKFQFLPDKKIRALGADFF